MQIKHASVSGLIAFIAHELPRNQSCMQQNVSVKYILLINKMICNILIFQINLLHFQYDLNRPFWRSCFVTEYWLLLYSSKLFYKEVISHYNIWRQKEWAITVGQLSGEKDESIRNRTFFTWFHFNLTQSMSWWIPLRHLSPQINNLQKTSCNKRRIYRPC